MQGMSIKEAKGVKHSHEVLQSIRHIDHVTYVAKAEHEGDFIQKWKPMGFEELVRLETKRFPATHIALTSGGSEEFPWETMTGLSISRDPYSPINEFVQHYGETIQHVAYNIAPEADMEILHRELKKIHWNFMTPVLSYQDDHGARLKQMFTAPDVPCGTFIELVQRLPGVDGEVFNGFDTTNIDDLYQHYAAYSAWLIKERFSSWKANLGSPDLYSIQEKKIVSQEIHG